MMAGELICSKLALAKSGRNGSWVLGTLYVHHNDIRFEPSQQRPADVTTHLVWPAVSRVECSRAGPLEAVQVAHSGGVESYLCVGAKHFAHTLAAVRSQSRASPPRPFAKVA